MTARWDVTPREAKEICIAVIEQATVDLFYPVPPTPPSDASETKKHGAKLRRQQVERDRSTAETFFFSSSGSFRWMAEGLGGDLVALREALRGRSLMGRLG